MWCPGDVLVIWEWDDEHSMEVKRVALVVSVTDTGWGTLGQKWDGVILHRGHIQRIDDAWRKRWSVVSIKAKV